ncbi:hypothetical protein BDP27DRAFT_1418172 [Rhodocollybia butyracea]|uniref:Uncharacterized protein n=1 Tax=Rhodocollybia butyracea TaxID=206335 RepID=A0A9P5U9R5_9AGAR|nr:hypothetical protein BDP27DRAFT_1418172 [Rhodocollybia butyracea]
MKQIIPIDPALLPPLAPTKAPNRQANSSAPVPGHSRVTRSVIVPTPTIGLDGKPVERRDEMEASLKAVKVKQPLFELCTSLPLPKQPAKKATLEKLYTVLLDFWYLTNTVHTANTPALATSSPSHALLNTLTADSALPTSTPASAALVSTSASPDFIISTPQTDLGHSKQQAQLPPPGPDDDGDGTQEELRLVDEFGGGGMADDILAYDNDDFTEEEEWDLDNDKQYDAFQTKLRVDATKLAEGNCRAGGKKTQAVLVRLINEIMEKMLFEKKIRDCIVDECFLLLLIEFNAKRPKRTRRGTDIEGTFLGAEQEAQDSTLRGRRPSTSVTVWDALKSNMDISLHRARSGLVPGEDAPDITANTFLSSINEEQILSIGLKGFLKHRELRSVVFGHLAWVAQHATGNRGDDFRALKLAELQPHVLLHPNQETAISCMLGLQGEEKAGKRGLQTVINPSYTTFIAHRNAQSAPSPSTFTIFLT